MLFSLSHISMGNMFTLLPGSAHKITQMLSQNASPKVSTWNRLSTLGGLPLQPTSADGFCLAEAPRGLDARVWGWSFQCWGHKQYEQEPLPGGSASTQVKILPATNYYLKCPHSQIETSDHMFIDVQHIPLQQTDWGGGNRWAFWISNITINTEAFQANQWIFLTCFLRLTWSQWDIG